MFAHAHHGTYTPTHIIMYPLSYVKDTVVGSSSYGTLDPYLKPEGIIIWAKYVLIWKNNKKYGKQQVEGKKHE
jgi:hypothetical protein